MTLTDQMNAEWDRVAPIAFIMPREDARRATQRLFAEYLHNRPLQNDTESAKNLGLLYADGVESFPVHRQVFYDCSFNAHTLYQQH